jgi:hypothetical protein
MSKVSKQVARGVLALLAGSLALSAGACRQEVCNCPMRSDTITITTKSAMVKTLTLSGPACVGSNASGTIVSVSPPDAGVGTQDNGFVSDSLGYQITPLTTGTCTVTVELENGQSLVKSVTFTQEEGCCAGMAGGETWDLDAALCQLDACPKTCPDGQEMFNPDKVCCGTCQMPSQACLDARAQWQSELAARWATAKTCTRDADCVIATLNAPCMSSCLDAIAFNQLDDLTTWASTRGDELCTACTTKGTPTGCTIFDGGIGCRNGTCAMNVR